MDNPTQVLSPYPYLGLRPYRESEADIFFGRNEQVDRLLGKLADHRFLAVVGPSGCGKSSLVRAGMIPALETGFLVKAGFQWRCVQIRPGDRPLTSLAHALTSATELSSASTQDEREDELAFLRATLRRGPLGMVEALRLSSLGPQENMLLVVDQFEELFRFEKLDVKNEARAFVELLLTSAQQSEVPIYVVITMRSDFLGNCPEFVGLPEAITDSQFLTPRLSRSQLEEAIVGPAALHATHIEPELLSCILNEVGTDPDQLPLMQHVLLRLWWRAMRKTRPGEVAAPSAFDGVNQLTAEPVEITLTLDDYRAVGGLANALSDHADQTFFRLETDERKRIAEIMFRCLTEITPDGQMVRRPARISGITSMVDAGLGTRLGASSNQLDVIAVVEAFRRDGRSFLSPPPAVRLTDDSVIDITHESLIRQWARLREWTVDEADSRRVAAMVAKEAVQWKESEHDEDRLLTGVRLSEAAEWRTKPTTELDQTQDEFLQASLTQVEESQKAHRYLQWLQWAVAYGVVVTLFAIYVFFKA